jgi:ethanolamine ammonia-lyase small subunit
MARVGLGRAGNSLPTRELLDFQLAHARARDAVHFPLDSLALLHETEAAGWAALVVKSAAGNRAEYLRRPDLGRRLDAASVKALEAFRPHCETVFVIADGLSALAVHRHAPPLLNTLTGITNASVVIAEQSRVAIGDEIGQLLNASLAVVMIGERPGLSSPDSMGVYLTWAPRVGRTDAERNCISNIRADGLSPEAAGQLLMLMMADARARQISGVQGWDSKKLQMNCAEHNIVRLTIVNEATPKV